HPIFIFRASTRSLRSNRSCSFTNLRLKSAYSSNDFASSSLLLHLLTPTHSSSRTYSDILRVATRGYRRARNHGAGIRELQQMTSASFTSTTTADVFLGTTFTWVPVVRCVINSEENVPAPTEFEAIYTYE